MAILYKGNETDYTTFGLGPLDDAISILVTEERNGIFELEMKYPASGKRFKDLKLDRIIKANAGHTLKDQRFKIIRITKPLKQVVTVYAEHISYLTKDLAFKPKVDFFGNALTALTAWKAGIIDKNPFTVASDISTSGRGEWTIDEVDNPRRALGGVRGSMLDVYGGEYRFDNYHIQLMKKRGSASGALIAYGRNLIDLVQEEEIANTYTTIYPYATHTDEEGNSRLITLKEYYVDSEHVNKYSHRKILLVDFTQDEIKDEPALRNRAKRYIIENNVGIPNVNLKLKYIDLSKTIDYKNYLELEKVSLCDTLPVYFEQHDINAEAKIITTVWDDLKDQYDSIELGEARYSLSDSIDYIVDGKVERIDDKVNRVQMGANLKSRNFRGPDEPKTGMSKGDLWYQPVGDGETMLYRFDGAYWKLEKVSTGLLSGKLDALNGDVDIINLNANNVAAGTFYGLKYVNTFLRGTTPGVLTIDGDIKMQAGNKKFSVDEEMVLFDNGIDKTTLGHNGLQFYRNAELIGEIKIEYFSTTDETAVTLSNAKKGTNGIRINQNRIEVTERNQGANDLDIFVIPSGEGQIIVADPTKFSWKGIRALNYELPKKSKIYENAEGGMEIHANTTLTLRQGGGDYGVNMDASRFKLQRDLNMSGYQILNTSDGRLKKDVKKFNYRVLKDIRKWQLVSYKFDYLTETEEEIGMIAQDACGISQIDSDGLYAINLNKHVFWLTKGLQELDKEKDDKIKALEKRIEKLEKLVKERG